MGSYYAMLDGVYNLHAEDGRPVFRPAPGYRGSVVDDPRYDALDVRVLLLRPAHYVDRLIRPNQWANAPMDFTPEDWVTKSDKSPFQR